MTVPHESQSPSQIRTEQSSDQPADWLMKYEPWLKLLARLEIDSRFHGKFSASDAVQQTMMEAWRDWNAFRGSEHAQRLAWLRKILAHQLAHLARRYAGAQKRDVSREVSLEHSLTQSSVRLENMLAADLTSPSNALIAREREVMVAQVLDRLPEEYREVIVLRNLENRGYAEIAAHMQRSEGAVRMLWVRALERLRKETLAMDPSC